MFKEWHKTKTDLVYGFLDDFYVENNNLRISGWLVPSVEKEECEFYFELDGKLLVVFCYNERIDVAAAYETNNIAFVKSGYDVSIPKPKNSNIKLLVKHEETFHEIYNLDTDIDYKKLIKDTSIQEYSEIKLSSNMHPEIIVIDNFYDDPHLVREVALKQSYDSDLRFYKGRRTSQKFLAPGTKQVFEQFLGKRITAWEEHGWNGIFQYCTAEDALVIHSDQQSFAGVVFLSPDAPPQTGTSFYRSKKYPQIRSTHSDQSNYNEVYQNDYYDKTRFELVDNVGNVFNRLVLWDARLIHSASEYFGNNKENSRLFHLFFFDTE